MWNRWIERRNAILLSAISAGTLMGIGLATISAAEPAALHARINQLMAASHIGPTSPPASDAEFMRRIYLDLIGRIPSVAEARAFLDDSSDKKRAKLVDNLLRRDQVNRHFATVFDIWLMERRKDQHVTTDQWREYLYRSLASNKPYNELAAEILAARGALEDQKPAAKFYLDRNVETHSLTRDISRVFFGRDVQCAQCHDHPLISDYLQAEYYGLFSFVSRSYLFQGGKDNKQVAVAEKPDGDASYASVFEPDSEKTTAVPALADGAVLYDEPQFVPGEGYRVKPAKDVQPIPEFSRREQLSRLATDDRNQMFNTNIANRLWRHMLGRGLVEPPDLHHEDNPAAYPELLRMLADELVEGGYDIKAFLREVALCDAYQRSIDAAGDFETAPAELNQRLDELKTQLGFQQSVLERLDAEADDALDRLMASRGQLTNVRTELQAALGALGKARKSRDDAAAALAKTQQELAAKQSRSAAIAAAAEAAATAVAQLADDKDLAQAAKTFEDRKQKAATELAACEKKQSEQSDAHEKALASCAEIEETLPSLRSSCDRVLHEVRSRHGAHTALHRQRLNEASRHTGLQQNFAVVRKLLDLHEQTKQAATLAATIEALNGQRAGLQSELTRLQGLEQETVVRLATTRGRLSEHQQKLNDALQSVETHKTTVESVRLAAEKTELAANGLPNDSGLSQAHAILVERVETLAAKVAELEANAESCRRQVEDSRVQEATYAKQLAAQRGLADQHSRNLADLRARSDEVRTRLEAAEQKVDQSQSKLERTWLERFAVATLRPLSPEEFSSSVVQALGLEARYRNEAEAEWKNKNKDKQPDEIKPEDKVRQIEELYNKRRANTNATFIGLFASSPGSPQDVFHATIDQALFFANDGHVRDWLRPTAGSLTRRLKETTDDQQVAEEIYLSTLSRRPKEEESGEVIAYLRQRKDNRPAALQELVWSLLTSIEFRFK